MDALVVNGWTLYAHPCFIEQVDRLLARVAELRQRDPRGWRAKNDAKRLAAVVRLAFDIVPQDPARKEYWQGDTLGHEHRHWFRAKFFQQYRLFFRFDLHARVIVYAWVNDDASLRAYGSGSDAYRVFSRMLGKGKPPGGWVQLMREARAAKATWAGIAARLDAIA
jgi:toxin YhaV